MIPSNPRKITGKTLPELVYDYLATRRHQGASALAIKQNLDRDGYNFSIEDIRHTIVKGINEGTFMSDRVIKSLSGNTQIYKLAQLPSPITVQETTTVPIKNKTDYAPRPSQGEWSVRMYDIVDANCTDAKPWVSYATIRKYLPAVLDGKPMPTHKRLRQLLSSASYQGYLETDQRGKGNAYFKIASREYFEARFSKDYARKRKERGKSPKARFEPPANQRVPEAAPVVIAEDKPLAAPTVATSEPAISRDLKIFLFGLASGILATALSLAMWTLQ